MKKWELETEQEILDHMVEYYIDDGNAIGGSHVQREYKIGYNKAQRVIELGIEQHLLRRDENEPWRVKFIQKPIKSTIKE